ncbi:MAG: hypothetical protein IID33_13005, partial [Planctomycetes bacterium]|nr:hypothetical protein [Planctomycetota bacterium]
SIHAYDLSERKHIWSAKASRLGATASGNETARGAEAVWTTVAASADYVVAAGRSLYLVLDAATGRSLGRFESPEFDPLANAVVTRGDRIYVISRSRPGKPDAPLLLWRSVGTGGQLVRLGTLDGTARDVRAVDLVGGLLLIVEQNRVSGYTLP